MVDPEQAKCGFFWDNSPTNEEQLRLIEEVRKLEEAKAAQEEKRLQRDLVKRGYGPEASDAPRTLLGRSLAGVAMHAIEWLWTGLSLAE